MDKKDFIQTLIGSQTPLLADGAMGTMLHERGADFATCFDELNLTDPALVMGIHRAYLDAGARLIMTNTFGANRYRLAEHGLEDKVAEINRAGVDLAHQAVKESVQDAFIAGDVGPLGVRLAPFGRVQPEDARAAFTEQIQSLLKGKPDLIIIETMTDLYEVHEAIKAAKALSDLPVIASMTFTRDDRTLLGDSPVKVAKGMAEAGADVIGVNCSGGPAQLLRILKEIRAAQPDRLFSVMPNAGWPEQAFGRIMYPAGPDYFGQYARSFRQAGAAIIGGCCGTTPDHVRTMQAALLNPPSEDKNGNGRIRVIEAEPDRSTPTRGSLLAEKLKAGKFSIAVEMDPPRGLSIHKLIAGASLLAEAGADVINVADSPMARMRMSPWAVCDLIQRQVKVETTLHFPTRGRNLLRVQGDLLAAHALGVRNVFVIMGDPTAIGDYPDAMDNYDLAPTGLIKLIKQGFNAGVDHAGSEIGQPTAFYVGAALNLAPKDLDREIQLLRRKIANGSDFFLTQPVYAPEKARTFIEACDEGIDKPLMVGILPLYGPRHAAFLHNEVPGISISDEIRTRLETAGKGSPKEGVKIAIELIQQIREWGAGVYLMPAFDRYDLAADIIDAVK